MADREHGPIVKGRIVRYFEPDGPKDGVAAMVIWVKEDHTRVHLQVFYPTGEVLPRFNVTKLGFEASAKSFWEWSQRQ